jgi:hemoglobin/transferrin/lactoferrin receptor protein
MNRSSRRHAAAALLLGFAVALPAAAAEQPEAEAAKPAPPQDQEEKPAAAEPPAKASFFATTTVTATGREEDSFEVATPVTVISAEEIRRRQPENAADLLRDQAGVDVNGVGGNQARPIIRGQRGLRVLYMEDGLRLNNARRQTDFGEITSLVDLDSVEAVEVVRGPASVLYGSDAIGGVLNLVTRRPTVAQGRRLAGSAELRYGSASDLARLHASVDGRFDKLAFTLAASRRKSGDYQAPAGSFGDITLPRDAAVLDTGVDDDSVYAYLDYRPAERHDLFLRYTRYRADQTGFGLVDPADYGVAEDTRVRILYPYQNFDRLTLGYFGSALESPLADSLEVQVYGQRNERQLRNLIDVNIGPLFPGAPDSGVAIDTLNFTDLDTLGGRAEAIKVAGGRNLLTYGAEYFRDDSVNTDHSTVTTTLRFPFPPFEIEDLQVSDVPNAPDATNSSYGAFLQDEITAADRLKVTAGVRYQRVTTRAEPTRGWDVTGLDFEDDNAVWAASALYRVADYLHLVASYGTAFRAPNIIERLFNGPTPEGAGFQILNPELKSERSDNYDLGLKYRRRDAWLEAIYFRSEIDDGIIQDFLSDAEIAALPQEVRDEIAASGAQFVVQQRNVDRIRYRGVEVGLGYRSPWGLSLGGNYTHLTGQRIGLSAVPLENTFSDKVNLYARYDRPSGRFWLEYRVRHQGSEPTQIDPGDPVPPVGRTLPAFTVHTLAGGVRLFERGPVSHTLTVTADNFTDELYAEFSNATFFRPQPGRDFVASYRVRF